MLVLTTNNRLGISVCGNITRTSETDSRAVFLELVCDFALVECFARVELLLEPRKVTNECRAVADVRLPETCPVDVR